MPDIDRAALRALLTDRDKHLYLATYLPALESAVVQLLDALEQAEREPDALKKRHFPIQDGPSVPWAVMAPHEAAAMQNHSQSLDTLARRGGLAASEAWCVVKNVRRTGLESKEDWIKWTEAWSAFAERINLGYEEADALKAKLAASEQRLEQLVWVQSHTFTTCRFCEHGYPKHEMDCIADPAQKAS